MQLGSNGHTLCLMLYWIRSMIQLLRHRSQDARTDTWFIYLRPLGHVYKSLMWHSDQKSVGALVLAIVNEAQTA